MEMHKFLNLENHEQTQLFLKQPYLTFHLVQYYAKCAESHNYDEIAKFAQMPRPILIAFFVFIIKTDEKNFDHNVGDVTRSFLTLDVLVHCLKPATQMFVFSKLDASQKRQCIDNLLMVFMRFESVRTVICNLFLLHPSISYELFGEMNNLEIVDNDEMNERFDNLYAFFTLTEKKEFMKRHIELMMNDPELKLNDNVLKSIFNDFHEFEETMQTKLKTYYRFLKRNDLFTMPEMTLIVDEGMTEVPEYNGSVRSAISSVKSDKTNKTRIHSWRSSANSAKSSATKHDADESPYSGGDGYRIRRPPSRLNGGSRRQSSRPKRGKPRKTQRQQRRSKK